MSKTRERFECRHGVRFGYRDGVIRSARPATWWERLKRRLRLWAERYCS